MEREHEPSKLVCIRIKKLQCLESLTISIGVIIVLRALALGVLKNPKCCFSTLERERESLQIFWTLNDKSAPRVSLLYSL